MLGTARRLVGETPLGVREQPFQLGAIGDDPALRRGPGAQATAQRTHLVVGVGFLGSDLLDVAFDAHLALQRRPEEGHGRPRIGRQLLALGAFVVGEEGEAALVEALEQEDTAMRIAVGVDGGQGHGVGFDRQALGLHRVVEPLAEQAEGIARGVGLAEAIAGVLAAHIGQGLGHGASPGGNAP